MAHLPITGPNVTGQDIPDFGDGQGLFVLTTDSQTDNVTSGNAIVTSAAGDISGNTFTFGVGNNDYVQVGNATVTATTTDPSGAAGATLTIGDLFSASTIAGDTINFGDGNSDHVAVLFNDTVTATSGPSANIQLNMFALNIANDHISFGNGNGDYVELAGQITATSSGDSNFGFSPSGTGINGDTISMGSGNGDFISASAVNVSLTNTPGSYVPGTTTAVFYQGLSNDTITIGSGKDDHVTSDGSFYKNTITLGNGNNDYVLVSVQASTSSTNGGQTLDSPSGGDNTIALGNGNNDTVTITGSGGDVINTGTGANDQINVGGGFGSFGDTFGFALGTSGKNFTTVTGAQSLDQVEVNGGQLGSTLSPLSGATTQTTLASYIKSLGTLTPGDTYVGHNTTDTFVVTDAASGQTGAIEIVGVFHPTQANLVDHVLTLA
jgi:hypothetical protein